MRLLTISDGKQKLSKTKSAVGIQETFTPLPEFNNNFDFLLTVHPDALKLHRSCISVKVMHVVFSLHYY